MLSASKPSKARPIGPENSEAAASRPGRKYVLVPTKKIPRLVRWSFLLLAFTMPLQAADLAFLNGSVSLAKISGLLFFAFFILYNNPLLFRNALPAPPKVLWWFVAYLVTYTLHFFFIPEEVLGDFISRFATLVQLIVLFWCAVTLFDDETLIRRFLFMFSMGALIFGLGVLLHLPGFAVTESVDERVTALGNDPNAVAQLMAVAAVIMIGLYLNTAFKRFINKILCVLLIIPFLVVMVETGSRGGALAFLTGCLIYSVPFWNSKRRWAALTLGVVCIGVVVYLTVTNAAFSERVEESVFEGDLAHREDIYPAAAEMFLERPLFGWHPIELWYQLNDRTGWRSRRQLTDTHNLILHVLLEGGLIGAVPFLIGIGSCVWAAWKSRSGNLHLCPLALIVAVLIANMSTTGIYDKHLWVFLAITVAAYSRSRRARRTLPVLVRSTGSPQVA